MLTHLSGRPARGDYVLHADGEGLPVLQLREHEGGLVPGQGVLGPVAWTQVLLSAQSGVSNTAPAADSMVRRYLCELEEAWQPGASHRTVRLFGNLDNGDSVLLSGAVHCGEQAPGTWPPGLG